MALTVINSITAYQIHASSPISAAENTALRFPILTPVLRNTNPQVVDPIEIDTLEDQEKAGNPFFAELGSLHNFRARFRRQNRSPEYQAQWRQSGSTQKKRVPAPRGWS